MSKALYKEIIFETDLVTLTTLPRHIGFGGDKNRLTLNLKSPPSNKLLQVINLLWAPSLF